MVKVGFNSAFLQDSYNRVKAYFNYMQKVGIDPTAEPPENPITVDYFIDNKEYIKNELKKEIADKYTDNDTRVAGFYNTLDSVNEYVSLINSFCSIYTKGRKFI